MSAHRLRHPWRRPFLAAVAAAAVAAPAAAFATDSAPSDARGAGGSAALADGPQDDAYYEAAVGKTGGLLHDRVTSELACPVGRVGRMSLCRSRIPKS
ncbi:hypothetical protein ACFVJ4_43845, partial [Streptomyces sp. NPDC127178]